MALPSWVVLYCSQEVAPLGVLSSSGVGQASQKAEECLNKQINEQLERRLWIPIQVLGKCLSIPWWKGLDLGPEGESGSTCPLPPAAGSLKNNEEWERQWHVGGSWLQLIENRPFVLFNANVFRGLHSWGCRAGQGGSYIYVCVCVRWSLLSLRFNQLSLLNKLPIRIAYGLTSFSSCKNIRAVPLTAWR